MTLRNDSDFIKISMVLGHLGGAQLVKRPTLAQVMISWFVSSSPELGSVLIARSM